MRVSVKLFASLPRHVPGARPGVPLDVELSGDPAITDLLDHIGLPAAEVKVVFVNGRARPPEWRLQPDDQVGIFPPIGGG